MDDRRNWIELGLNSDEQAIVDEAAALYKTSYLDALETAFKVGRGLVILQKRHSGMGMRGGFAEALVQCGFTDRAGGPMQKSIRSDYTTLFEHEAEVRKWWDDVPSKKKRFWMSVRAIARNWRNSKKPKDTSKKKDSPYTAMKATNIALQEQLHEMIKNQGADGKAQFDLETTGAESIGKIIVHTWRQQPSRIETLIRTLSAELKELRALIKAARPKQRKRGKKAIEEAQT
jgi:hypothetical protein